MEAARKNEARTYLTFTLDEEVFAVDVFNVREVLDYTSVTKVPRTPDFMKGVINLRGSVVPVVDMRLKFGIEEAEITVDSCIIVMEVSMEGEATVIGALADSVKEVFDLDPGNIEPAPRIGTRLDTEFISGMGKYRDNFIIILDIDRIFSADELVVFKEATENLPKKGSRKTGRDELQDPDNGGDGSGSTIGAGGQASGKKKRSRKAKSNRDTVVAP